MEKQNTTTERMRVNGEFMRTETELKQIVDDLVNGKIFTNCHCSASELATVFMPFGLMDAAGKQEMTELDPGMIFEYIDKAGPRSINGKPMFFSFQWLTQDEFSFIAPLYEEAVKQKIEAANA